MRVKLGQWELDLLNKDELRETLHDELDRLVDDEETVRPDAQGKTDAAGNLVVEVYNVPLGYEFALHRLVVVADGYTPAAPFINAAGYITVLRSGTLVDFLGLGVGGIPSISTDGSDAAARFRNGEVVEVGIANGPVTKNVQVKLQGTLKKHVAAVD